MPKKNVPKAPEAGVLGDSPVQLDESGNQVSGGVPPRAHPEQSVGWTAEMGVLQPGPAADLAAAASEDEPTEAEVITAEADGDAPVKSDNGADGA